MGECEVVYSKKELCLGKTLWGFLMLRPTMIELAAGPACFSDMERALLRVSYIEIVFFYGGPRVYVSLC